MANILVVDDELGIRDLLFEILNDEGHAVELAENAARARALRLDYRPDLVLLDIWMPDTDGVTLLKEWASSGLLDMPVIMMSGHATIDTAVEATRIGAMAFLEKPITLQKLLHTVDQGLQRVLRSAVPERGVGLPLVPVVPLATPPAASTQVPTALPGALLPDASTAVAGALSGNAAAGLTEHSPEAMAQAGLLRLDFDAPLRDARDAFEKAYFEFHLNREGGSMTRVADKTGLERTHLYRKLKQLGVDLSKTRRSMG